MTKCIRNENLEDRCPLIIHTFYTRVIRIEFPRTFIQVPTTEFPLMADR